MTSTELIVCCYRSGSVWIGEGHDGYRKALSA